MSKAFAILGLPETATPDEVRAKWRELVKVHHPDRGGNPCDFTEIHKAYMIAMKEASAPKPCPQCNGTGKIKQSHGFSSIDMLCMACGGTGHVQ